MKGIKIICPYCLEEVPTDAENTQVAETELYAHISNCSEAKENERTA